MAEDFSTRIFNLVKRRREVGRKLTKEALAQELEVSRTMLYNYERSDPPPPPELLSSLVKLEREVGIEQTSNVIISDHGDLGMMMVDTEAGSPSFRNAMIPVVGWAHAGAATEYDELPDGYEDRIPTECRDPRAFAVRLEGDSMMPRFEENDLLILMPSEEVYNGVLAVVRLRSGGVIFRRLELRDELYVLIPLNQQYEAERFRPDEISWAYPLWGMWRQIEKRRLR